MNGELDFSESLKARVALLKGVPANIFDQLKSVITITPGARELCKALKRLGFKMAVLSGGFTPLAEWLAGELGLDYAYANHVCSKPNPHNSVRPIYQFESTCIIQITCRSFPINRPSVHFSPNPKPPNKP